MDMKEIISAWIIKSSPTENQQRLAKERYNICLECPSRTSLFKQKKWSEYCQECGCPLQGKVFTPKYNTCPLGKWKEVEDLYLIKDQKKERTTI